VVITGDGFIFKLDIEIRSESCDFVRISAVVFLGTRSPGFGAGDALRRGRQQAASQQSAQIDAYMRVNDQGSDPVTVSGFASLDTNQVK
jgi:hypothetical protein